MRLVLASKPLLLFQRRVLKMHNDYYYTDIKGTPFRWSKSFITKWRSPSLCWWLQVNMDSPVGSILCLCLQCRCGTLQRSWEVLLQGKCVSWSWYVISTVIYEKPKHSERSFTLSCFLVGLLYQSLQAGAAEALLTCVFQGSVISNSQMSPWQMNGNTGVVEVGIHALCRLFLPAHQGCEWPVM